MHTVIWLEWLNLLAITVNAISFALNYGSVLHTRRLSRRLLDCMRAWDAEVNRMAMPTALLDELRPE